MKNFLLVNPRFVNKGEYYNFPLGLGYVSSFLKQRGFNVYCLNLCHFDKNISTEDILREYIEKYNIDVFCTGTLSWYWDEIDYILKLARKIKPNIINIVGGAIVISDPDLALKNLDMDIGIMGEGEITMAELAEKIDKGEDTSNVQGITLLKDGKVVITPPRPVIDNLDSLPFPDYEGYGFEEWKTLIRRTNYIQVADKSNINYSEIIGSRSCPFRCTFCYHHLGDKYRQRSLDNIFMEIEHLINNYGINYFYFLDELFSANHQRMLEFAERIKKYNIVGWGGSFRVNDVSLEVLKTLKGTGLKYTGYGIENINDCILESMKKKITIAEIEKALESNRQAKMVYSGNIIYGDPAETEETAKKTLKYIFEHPQYNFSQVFLRPIPNSEVYQLALKRGIIKDRLEHVKKRFPIVNLTKMSDRKFYKLFSQINWIDESIKHIKQGKIINSELKKSSSEINIYKFEAECPFCKTTSYYEREFENLKKIPLICQNCISTFYVPGSFVFPGKYKSITANLDYFKKFVMAYSLRFKFYRKHGRKILSVLIKTKRMIKSSFSILKSKFNK